MRGREIAWKTLTDSQWHLIEAVIPRQRTGRPRSRNREILDAILYVLSTNIRCEEMPPGFPPKMTVYDCFQVWRKEGFFGALFEQAKLLKPATDKRLYYLDASIKSAKKGGKISRAGKIQGSKISLVADEKGLSESIHVEAAGRNDRYAFGNIVKRIPKNAYLAADKGYDCNKLRRRLRQQGLRPLIPR